MACSATDAGPFVALFFKHARIDSGCWLWDGSTNHGIYGAIRSGGKTILAHRFSWSFYNGESIPDGKVICHTCDVPKCVNPNHLFLGTQTDNVADKVMKGRQARGEGNAGAKLTEQQVREIRKYTDTHKATAAQYGVTLQTIYQIRKQKKWSHIQ